MKRLKLSGFAAALLAASVVTPAFAVPSDFGSVTSATPISFGDTFGALAAPVAGSLYNFTDAYTFSTTGASASAVTVSLNLPPLVNISNLQIAIFTGDPLSSLPGATAPGYGSFVGYTGSTSGAVGGATWISDVVNPTAGTVSLTGVPLASGPYTLEVRGDVTGTAGGGYAGVFSLAPIPEPQSWALLVCGLGLIGLAVSRRRI